MHACTGHFTARRQALTSHDLHQPASSPYSPLAQAKLPAHDRILHVPSQGPLPARHATCIISAIKQQAHVVTNWSLSDLSRHMDMLLQVRTRQQVTFQPNCTPLQT